MIYERQFPQRRIVRKFCAVFSFFSLAKGKHDGALDEAGTGRLDVAVLFSQRKN